MKTYETTVHFNSGRVGWIMYAIKAKNRASAIRKARKLNSEFRGKKITARLET